MKIGEFLRSRREKVERSLRWVAIKADISSAYLSDIENGKKSAPADIVLERLSKALSLSEDDKALLFRLALLDKTPEEIRNELGRLEENQKRFEMLFSADFLKENGSEDLKSFIAEFSALSPEEIKETVTFIEFLKFKAQKKSS